MAGQGRTQGGAAGPNRMRCPPQRACRRGPVDARRRQWSGLLSATRTAAHEELLGPRLFPVGGDRRHRFLIQARKLDSATAWSPSE